MLVVVGILIKITSKGPVLFRQVRMGKEGKTFRIYKFRTMTERDRSKEIITTPDDDPEITRIGRVLRIHKIDEMPQFLNVLQGDMSVCGPRPDLPEYVATYSKEEYEILSVKPGITDLASISTDTGRLVSGLEDPESFYISSIRPRKLRLQLEYVRNKSVILDAKIMIMTLKTPFLPFFDNVKKSSSRNREL